MIYHIDTSALGLPRAASSMWHKGDYDAAILNLCRTWSVKTIELLTNMGKYDSAQLPDIGWRLNIASRAGKSTPMFISSMKLVLRREDLLYSTTTLQAASGRFQEIHRALFGMSGSINPTLALVSERAATGRLMDVHSTFAFEYPDLGAGNLAQTFELILGAPLIPTFWIYLTSMWGLIYEIFGDEAWQSPQ